MGSLNEHSNDLQKITRRFRGSNRSGRGFGSVDAAYRRATGRRRQKPKIETSYYAAVGKKINAMMESRHR